MRPLKPLQSGREARRDHQFGAASKRKGAGWTRPFRKGRVQRLPYFTAAVNNPETVNNEEDA